MKAYYISRLDIKEWEKFTGELFNFEKIKLKKEYTNFENFEEDCRNSDDSENCILIRFFEKTKVEVSKFNEENGDIYPYNEELDGFFVKISCAVLPNKMGGLLITKISGLSVILRGLGGRRYLDNVIGPMVCRYLLGDSHYYSPFSFRDNDMDWNLWGEELKGIIVDIPDLGRSNFSGQNLSLKTVGHKKIPIMDLVSSGKLRRLNVLNKSLGRTIGINRNGTIYSSKNLLGMVSFINSMEKVFV